MKRSNNERNTEMIFEQDDLQLRVLDVLYFDETNNVSVNRLSSFCALSLRLDTDCEIDIEPDRRSWNRTIRMKPHDLAFFPPELRYRRRSKRDRMIVIHFLVENRASYGLEVLHDFAFDVMKPLFTEIFKVWNERQSGYRLQATAILYQIFAEIYRRTDRGEKLSRVTAEAIGYISAHLADNSLSVALLAERAHMSETYFRKLFSADTGRTPKKYINDLRLERACSLLDTGCFTVAAIAERTGFSDPKNFSTAFRKAFGCPPSAYRYAPERFGRYRKM